MSRRKSGTAVSGWVILDKPEGLGSTSAVARVRRLFDAKKAGHGGTLDPLASGLLPIALGEATKTVPFIMQAEKRYSFTIVWGAETDSADREGRVTATSTKRPETGEILAVLPRFTGEIQQIPPIFSALKVDGARAYDLARAGEPVDLKPRPVLIHALTLEEATPEFARLTLRCGKGTYVRSLARDIARALGAHGHVGLLRRLSTGPFREDQMISLETLEELSHNPPGPQGLFSALRPLETALDDIPALALSELDAARLLHGQPVSLRNLTTELSPGATILATCNGKPVALAEVVAEAIEPRRVFNLEPQE